MTINRCVDPLSKLAVTRWVETTCYKQMRGYTDLPREVEYFYRSMDQLLKIKDELGLALFKRLETLFSVNVKLLKRIFEIHYLGCKSVTEPFWSRSINPSL